MKPSFSQHLKPFLLEFVLYGLFVCAYLLLVLGFLGNWLTRVFNQDRHFYAAIALVLVIVQATLLDSLIRWLLARLTPHKEE